MFYQDNYWVSLFLAITTMVTWGSNKIAVKYLTYPVAMYTIDYFTWVFIFHVILGFTMGADWFPPKKGAGMISNFVDIFKHNPVRDWFLVTRRNRSLSRRLADLLLLVFRRPRLV